MFLIKVLSYNLKKLILNLNNIFIIFPYILFFVLFSNLPFLKLHSSQGIINKEISVEFLKKLPSMDYIIGPGDILDIIISRELEEPPTRVVIDGEGTINLPKLKRVYVNGLTINELNSLLNRAYLKFVRFPEVETTIYGYRPIKVYLEGEVVNPGIHTLDGSLSAAGNNNSINQSTNNSINESTNNSINKLNLNNNFYSQIYTPYFPTVIDAIRASGGITELSDLKNIEIIRKDKISNGSGKITTTLNFEDFLEKGDYSQNIRIYDSDIIRIQRSNQPNNKLLSKAISSKVNPRFINVFVSGRVNDPGSKTVSRASVLSDAIDMAGGAKFLRGPVTFIRFEFDGSVDKRKLRLTKNNRGTFRNPNLREGDLIIVGESLLTVTNEVIREFTAPFQGLYSTYGLIKAISDSD